MKKLIIGLLLMCSVRVMAEENYYDFAAKSELTQSRGMLYIDSFSGAQNLTANYQAQSNMISTNLTQMTADATNGTLMCIKTAKYDGWFHFSGELGNNEAVEGAMFVDEDEQDHIEGHGSTPTTGTDHTAITGRGIMNISSGQVVTVRIKSLDAAAWTPRKAQFGLIEIK